MYHAKERISLKEREIPKETEKREIESWKDEKEKYCDKKKQTAVDYIKKEKEKRDIRSRSTSWMRVLFTVILSHPSHFLSLHSLHPPSLGFIPLCYKTFLAINIKMGKEKREREREAKRKEKREWHERNETRRKSTLESRMNVFSFQVVCPPSFYFILFSFFLLSFLSFCFSISFHLPPFQSWVVERYYLIILAIHHPHNALVSFLKGSSIYWDEGRTGFFG